ncbi:hypothetical protein [Rhizobacter sp. LjRoot28]|uniref:hypothetical protein n=1 Tax=Rhizobacter sp. LjRoot28 TaxID=3342309 RepID=UPI003ECF2BC1
MAHDDPWRLVFDPPDPATQPQRESLLGLGNGLLFVRAAPPEAAFGGTHEHGEAAAPPPRQAPGYYPGLYVAGFYNHAVRRIEGRDLPITALARLPDPFGLSFRHEGEATWFGGGHVESRRDTLHMAEGVARREWTSADAAGRRTQVVETRAVSMAEAGLAWVHWCVTPLDWSGAVVAGARLQTAVRNAKLSRTAAYEGVHLRVTPMPGVASAPAAMAVRADTLDGRRHVHIANGLVTVPPGEAMSPPERLAADAPLESTQRLHAACGQAFELLLWVRVSPTDGSGPAPADAMAWSASHATPLDAHREAWKALWERVVAACGDAALERALRFAAFHLLQAGSPQAATRDVGLPSRGWQEGYFGHVFWDAGFVLPFTCVRLPEVSAGWLEYRSARLGAARRAAQAAGHTGAMFPWRSAVTGDEETPQAQWIPPARRWKSDHTFLQRHIGATIAHDAWLQYLATGDAEHFVHCGGLLIVEIARYWASCATEGSDGRLEYHGVMGPDEYHERPPGATRPGLSNNAWTNAMAAWTLRCAAELPAHLDVRHWQALQRHAALPEAEIETWHDASRRIALPRLAGDVLSQFDGFDRLIPPQDANLPPPESRQREDWWLMARGDDVNRYQVIKQPDVPMLFHLLGAHGVDDLVRHLGLQLDEGWQARTLAHYLPLVSHESSLSRVVLAGALCAHDPVASWRHFRKALDTDLAAGPGSSTHEGLHLGAMGGCWDVLQRCYLGLWLGPQGIELRPQPPDELDDVTTVVHVRGHRLRLRLRGRRLQLACEAQGPRSLGWRHGERSGVLAAGRSVELDIR